MATCYNFQILLCKLSIFCILIPQTIALIFNLTSIGPENENVNITTFSDAFITYQGLQITSDERNAEMTQVEGKATYISPLHLWDKSTGNLTDFYTHFTFVIDSSELLYFADGLVFFLAPNGSMSTPGGAMGLPIDPVTIEPTSPFVAVEFDTFPNSWDPVSITPVTHVGIDINSLKSNITAVWYCNITHGIENEAWIRYDSSSHNLSIVFSTNATGVEDSVHFIVDLRDYLPEWVTIGFSAATGTLFEKHTVKSWEFSSTLQTNEADSRATAPPMTTAGRKKLSPGDVVGLVIGSGVLVCGLGLVGFGLWKRSRAQDRRIQVLRNN